MRITTWNINSVRLRIDQVLRLLEEVAPDVLCLQEIKAQDHQFPTEAFVQAGYPHIAVRGFKGYNGVATISRQPLTAQPAVEWCGRADGRHVAATCMGGIEVHNFYVPAGGDVPDPTENDKFAHKLQFLDEMQAWFTAKHCAQTEMILVGDLNIAPLQSDVWNHKQLLKVVSHTPVEIAALAAVQEASQWVDAVRQVIPAEQSLYSWWSYRARDWSAADKGRRLDHIWVTPALAARVRSAEVHRHVRGWEKASDHAPVSVDID